MIRIIILLVLGLVVWVALTTQQPLQALYSYFNKGDTVEVEQANAEDLHQNSEAETDIDESIGEALEVEIAAAEGTDAEVHVATDIDTGTENLTEADTARNGEAVTAEKPADDAITAAQVPGTLEDTLADSGTFSQAVYPHGYNPWATWGQAGMSDPMSPSNYMNMMGPMMNMMGPMMGMMGMMGPMMGMMNPNTYMNPMSMMEYPVNVMTHPQAMDAMMKSMDPQLMLGMFGQPNASYQKGQVPDQLPVVQIPGFPTQTYQNWPSNKVSPGVSREAKKNAFQTAMAFSPLSMRDMIAIMTDKLPVAEDVSWDDAVEAMKLRANEVNFKYVGSSPLWKEIEAITEKPSAKIEIFRFCDAAVARKILDEVPEFAVFLPCKIALIEDSEGKLWVMTLDWDVSWMDFAQNPNSHLSKELRSDAIKIRESIAYIMEGAATGDF